MNTSMDDLRDLLGLDSEATLTELDAAPAPADVQQARGASQLALAALLSGTPAFDALPVPERLPAHVDRAAEAPGVLAVQTADEAVVPLGGVHEHHLGALILDGRNAPAMALVLGDEADFVVIAEGDRARFVKVETPTVRATWSPDTAPLGDLPDVELYLARWTTEHWLAERVRALVATSWPLDTLAASGTLLRLWFPSGRAEKLEVLRTGARGPASEIAMWARALSAEQARAIVRLASIQVGQLHDRLDEAGDAAGDVALEEAVALELADRRDALQSAATVLALTEWGGAVRSMLRVLDREATERWSELPPAGVLAGVPWVGAVAAAEPDTWWSLFGVG